MVYMYHSFLIPSSADGHLGCFHVLAMINSAEMNIGVHVSLSDLVSSVCMPRSGIAGSYGSCISNFLKKSPYSSPFLIANWKTLNGCWILSCAFFLQFLRCPIVCLIYWFIWWNTLVLFLKIKSILHLWGSRRNWEIRIDSIHYW